jgi:hypothetical protein
VKEGEREGERGGEGDKEREADRKRWPAKRGIFVRLNPEDGFTSTISLDILGSDL